MAKVVDYYFSVISPFTYLGSKRFEEILQRHRAEVRVKPVSLAEIFPKTGGLPPAKRAPERQAYRFVELERWSKYLEMPLKPRPAYFPAPDIEAARDDYSILGWDMEPGDAIAFSFLTVHGAPGNLQSGARRRAFAARYCGGDVVFAQRAGEVSPPFPDVRLNHGEPLRGDDFPVVRG